MRRLAPILPALLLACSMETPVTPPAEEAPEKPAKSSTQPTALPYRLIDHLESAGVQSPLQEVEAADSLAGVGDVPHEVALELGFEDAPPSFPGDGCRVRPRADGRGKGLVYRGRNPHQCVFIVQATPSSHYRVSRAIRTDDSNIDFQVIESRSRLRNPDTLNHPADLAGAMNGRFVSMKQLLFVHHFDRPRPGDWDGSAVNFFTSPYTRSLVILLNDAEGLVKGSAGTTTFDDLRVERLNPSAAQELALLKSTDRIGDDETGLRKRGQLLPVGRLSEASPPVDDNFDYREALFAPSPSQLDYSLSSLGEKAQLSFSYALHKASRDEEKVTFRVRAKPIDGEERVLFEE
ncbi:MAG: hypothetical protein AAFQ82_12620, partial [Myxococcota bacterium]